MHLLDSQPDQGQGVLSERRTTTTRGTDGGSALALPILPSCPGAAMQTGLAGTSPDEEGSGSAGIGSRRDEVSVRVLGVQGG